MNVYYFLDKHVCKKYSEYNHVSSLLREISSRYGISDKSVDKTVYKNEEFNIKVRSLHKTPQRIHEEFGLKTHYDKKSALRVYLKKLAHKSFKIPAVRGIEPGSILHYFKPYPHKRQKNKFTKILEITSLKGFTSTEFFDKRLDIFNCIKLVEEADILVTHSDYMAEELKSKLFADENKIKIIPRGFNFSPPTLDKQNYAVFCGRIAKYKNLELMMNAFDKVAPKDMQLIIAGDAGCNNERSYFEHLKKVATEFPNDRIKLLGNIPYDNIHDVIGKAQFLIEPSYINDFPDTIIEAQSLGVPVIASDIAAHRSVCEKTVIYFPVLSRTDLENKIAAVLEDKKLNQEISAAGMTNAAKYSWDEVSQEYRSLYKSL